MLVLDVAVALVPVVLFLGALKLMDGWKLVSPSSMLASVGFGALAAVLSFALNTALLLRLHVDPEWLRHVVAPLIEEAFKGIAIVGLIRARRVGFLIDAALHGVAIGTGFAVVEGIYYLATLGPGTPHAVWIVRGLGTAVMHPAATALLAILSQVLTERSQSRALAYFVPGYALAAGCHALYNALLIVPLLAAVAMLVLMPALVALVFDRSERAMRDWLGHGFDGDAELLELIESGEVAHSHVGAYLDSLKGRLPGEVVADMLCLLQIHAELSMRAKGLLIARAADVTLPPDPEIRSRFDEMRFLERAIGPTGLLAILPLRRTSSRDLWHLHRLESH
jgi:RsiW-degrading membrane proteinase PrsW (M82 family)